MKSHKSTRNSLKNLQDTEIMQRKNNNENNHNDV